MAGASRPPPDGATLFSDQNSTERLYRLEFPAWVLQCEDREGCVLVRLVGGTGHREGGSMGAWELLGTTELLMLEEALDKAQAREQ